MPSGLDKPVAEATPPSPPVLSAAAVTGPPRWVTGSITINTLLSFCFGVLFLVIMLVFATSYPNPTPFQIQVFMTALAAAASGIGAVLPGYIHLRRKGVFRIGGAVAFFAIVWFSQPAISTVAVTLEEPKTSAEPVIDEFLAKIDSNDFAGSYQAFDALVLKDGAVTQEKWTTVVSNARTALGQVDWRREVGGNAFRSPPGAPIGLYRQVSYLTKFAGVSDCRTETITVRATQELAWVVNGYVISPGTVDCSAFGKVPGSPQG